MGVSMSSAEDSKKDMTVLSEHPRLAYLTEMRRCSTPVVRKIETCSALTAKPFLVNGECFSM
jgi:hypothetical protein